MERAVRIGGIKKRATPHTLRHSFACHTYEYTCDLRKIQKILGHVRLETTTIYVRVAKPTDGQEEKQMADPKEATDRSNGSDRAHENALEAHGYVAWMLRKQRQSS